MRSCLRPSPSLPPPWVCGGFPPFVLLITCSSLFSAILLWCFFFVALMLPAPCLRIRPGLFFWYSGLFSINPPGTLSLFCIFCLDDQSRLSIPPSLFKNYSGLDNALFVELFFPFGFLFVSFSISGCTPILPRWWLVPRFFIHLLARHCFYFLSCLPANYRRAAGWSSPL